ncbi:hypothetical protein KFE25_001939 [Diacronema lutheri]|uniref:Uncharacterized protein n=2 Tax=Diacronema lutheri TaxID=2081491 RepID=A0A8J5XK55_DIALT|nr:hypothetical protein KFE25_001939 [Diacronema lutheri]
MPRVTALLLTSVYSASTLVAPHSPLSSHDVRTIASDLGYDVRVSAFAAFVKVELLDADRRVAGEAYAFAQPNGILHWDSIQTRRGSDYYDRRNAARRGAPLAAGAVEKQAAASGIFGASVLLAAAVVAWVREDAPWRCHTAEALAIDDDDRQHRVLVRFYKVAGLVPVRKVGEGSGLQSVLDQLMYGGCGVIMHVGIDDLARTCARLMSGTSRVAGAQSLGEIKS